MSYDPRVVAAFNKAVAHTNSPDAAKRALFEAGIADKLRQPPGYFARMTEPYRVAVEFLGHAKPLADAGLSPGEIVAALHRGEFPDSTREEKPGE